MKKVAIITNIPSPYRVDLFYYLQTHVTAYDFHIIYTSKGEANRQWSVEQEKLINSHILSSKVIKIKGKIDDRYVHLPASIGRELSQINPQVVIAIEYNPAALRALAWCRTHNRKFIHLTDGTLYSERGIGSIQKLSRKVITRCADAAIASSTKAKEKLLYWGMPEEKIFVSLLTMDIEKYRNLVPNPVPGQLLYVGSMVKRKGLDLLIQALPLVNADVTLRIVGNGTDEERRELQAQAESLGVSEKIIWCGYLEGEALLREYANAAAFVLPTREDCYGLVLLEAYCAKLPIVSSKYADGAYDIVNNENGVLVDPYNAESLARGIERVVSEQQFTHMAQNNVIDKFAFTETTKLFLEALVYTA